jgi:RNA polymerase sigma factor (sigma-70 family)
VSAEEATLVRRCLDGELAAMRELIERFQGEVFGLSMRMLSHRHDAEDVSQEVFLRVFRSLRRWDPSRPLRPWIMGIAVNRCRTWLTQRARRPELVDYLNDYPGREVADDSQELVIEIRAAVHQLRPEYKAVFVMFHEQGKPYDEIALIMERPVGTVKTWLHRARLEVLGCLQRRGMMPENAPFDLSIKPLEP